LSSPAPPRPRLSVALTVYDRGVRILSLDGLERANRAAGWLQDVADLAEIQGIGRAIRKRP
jgi:hypothetical protein